MTWHLYKGDGKTFNTRWLKRRVMRFLTGAGQYTDDVTFAHQTCGYFLRSPHAHAKIRKIDTAKAKVAPGVVAIFTGDDLAGVVKHEAGSAERPAPRGLLEPLAAAEIGRGDRLRRLRRHPGPPTRLDPGRRRGSRAMAGFRDGSARARSVRGTGRTGSVVPAHGLLASPDHSREEPGR